MVTWKQKLHSLLIFFHCDFSKIFFIAPMPATILCMMHQGSMGVSFWTPLSVNTGPNEKDTARSWTRRSFQCSLSFYLSPSHSPVPNNRYLCATSSGNTWKTGSGLHSAQRSWWQRVLWCFWGEAEMLNTPQFTGSPDKEEIFHPRCHYGPLRRDMQLQSSLPERPHLPSTLLPRQRLAAPYSRFAFHSFKPSCPNFLVRVRI